MMVQLVCWDRDHQTPTRFDNFLYYLDGNLLELRFCLLHRHVLLAGRTVAEWKSYGSYL